MEYRKATISDIGRIMEIISQAQAYFKENTIDQWQNNYPNIETIQSDIKNEYGYVLLKDNIIVATAAISFDREKTYDIIYDGKWLTNSRYAVVHRLAVDNNHKGLGLSAIMLNNIEKICLVRGVCSVKIDTHEDNISMQRMLIKNGFKYCGIIYLEDNDMRLAYEKLL